MSSLKAQDWNWQLHLYTLQIRWILKMESITHGLHKKGGAKLWGTSQGLGEYVADLRMQVPRERLSYLRAWTRLRSVNSWSSTKAWRTWILKSSLQEKKHGKILTGKHFKHAILHNQDKINIQKIRAVTINLPTIFSNNWNSLVYIMSENSE